jgi:hypothetical protein
MLRVERQGPIVKLVYEGGEREAVSASCWSTLGLGCVSATRNKLLIYATPSLGATSSVSECGCAVVVADTEGRDPHQVIDAVAEHLRDVGLRPQLSFDKDRVVGLISLESGGRIAVVLAHPCLEAWLGELLEISSSTCSDLINRD